MKIKLNRCPFCGGKAKLYKDECWLDSSYQVVCSSCESAQNFVRAGVFQTYDKTVKKFVPNKIVTDKMAIKEAIDRWNNPRKCD